MELLLIALFILLLISTLCVLVWLAVLLHPAKPWDLKPVAEDAPTPPTPASWPDVAIIVPARNEADSLPKTLPALLNQDYPGKYRIVLVDDRSSDGTAEVARKLAAESGKAERLEVLVGQPLPEGFTGKVWAMTQGAAHFGVKPVSPGAAESPDAAAQAKYLLLTDADILHAPGSLQRLVAESEAQDLALNSRMARLRCVSPAEQLLIPAFVWFFNLLYPMRLVNSNQSRAAAAAGGCVLLRSRDLVRAGGFESIKDRLIDDVNLARRIKTPEAHLRLAVSRGDVASLREYPALGDIWKMVARTAYTELRYSPLRLLFALGGLALMFVMPFVVLSLGVLVVGLASAQGNEDSSLLLIGLILFIKGALAILVMAQVYKPAVRFFGLPGWRAFSFPMAGLLYGAMTFDSAMKYYRKEGPGWRDASPLTSANSTQK